MGRQLWMPFSHDRPAHLCAPGYYDQLMGRVADFVRLRKGRICGIDVGANIGDTIAACRVRNEDQSLAIQPSPVFFEYLNRNLVDFSTVRQLKVGCAASDSSPREGSGMEIKRVDTLVEQFPEFRDRNFLKIDTDGYDFEVLRGARELIARAQPVVLFRMPDVEQCGLPQGCSRYLPALCRRGLTPTRWSTPESGVFTLCGPLTLKIPGEYRRPCSMSSAAPDAISICWSCRRLGYFCSRK